jgi:hypothetical protein
MSKSETVKSEDLKNPDNAESENQNTESKSNAETETSKEGGTPSGAGSEADLAQITDDLISTQPEVQEHAIEQERANEDARAAQWADLRDRDGNGFDPSVHKTNKDGDPTLSPKGLLIKKPGRKPGQKTGQSQSSFVGGQNTTESRASNPDAAKIRMQARASGTMTANLLLQIGIVAGGEEWQPRVNAEIGLDEKKMLEDAFSDYYEATGKTDIPPGLALTVACGAYALPRFTMPKTRSRLSKLKDGVKKWWVNRKLKKHGLKAESLSDDKKEK